MHFMPNPHMPETIKFCCLLFGATCTQIFARRSKQETMKKIIIYRKSIWKRAKHT